ncbi:hypothetical protein KEM55_001356, partial [Ascosphaera atra]
QHASPQHLHITSRRTFIGPIPRGWLMLHGKSWYKRLLGLKHYSQRPLSFSAEQPNSQAQYARDRGKSAALKRFRQCMRESRRVPSMAEAEFPVEDEEEEDEEEADGMEGVVLPELQSYNLRQATHSSPKIGRSMDMGVGDANGEPAIRGGEEPLIRKCSSHRDDLTFVNAPETLSEVVSQTEMRGAGQSPEESTPTSGPREQRRSREGSTSPRTVASATPTSSDTPLLKSSRKTPVRSPRPSSRAISSIANPTSKSPTPAHDSSAASSSHPQRLESHTPIPVPERHAVSFAPAEEPAPRDLSLGDSGAPPISPLLEDERLSGRRGECGVGKIIKAERMLVRIDTTHHDVPNDYSEANSYRVFTEAKRDWMEHIVVCRRIDDVYAPFQLEFYTHRDISLDGKKRRGKRERISFVIPLDFRKTWINLFSTLDKTLAMWRRPHDDGGGRRKARRPWNIYIMRARSPAHSMEWYTFIRESLGWHRPSTVLVHVPDLGIGIQLHHVLQTFGNNPQVLARKDEAGGLEMLRSMSVVTEKAVSTGIIDMCVGALRDHPRWKEFVDGWERMQQLGLAWRRYDRLEWVHGGNETRMHGSIAMDESHQLELRKREHYPTTVESNDSDEEKIEEPPPVEGFLVLLTSRKGQYRRLGQAFSKPLYFGTHDQYLCFTRPAHASPPPPPTLPEISSTTGSNVPREHLRREMPTVHNVDPYPLNADNDIAWLRPRRRWIAQTYDLEAYREGLRNRSNLRETEGYFDLTQVMEVRPVDISDAQDASTWWRDMRNRDPNSNPREALFELVMSDGLVARLRAFNAETRDEWINRLRALSRYWSLRFMADNSVMRAVRQRNLRTLNINEAQESSMGQFARKWAVVSAQASAQVFNICNVSDCRAVKCSGELFCKSRRHARFERYGLMLVDGSLLVFQSYIRSISGQQIAHTHHDRVRALDLRECYVYSGLVTEKDLLYKDQANFNLPLPLAYTSHRVYLQDNWTSSDEDTATVFVVWANRCKTVSRTKEKVCNHENGGGKEKTQRWTRLPTLGVTGRSYVFKARSRGERDLWVLALQTEIDRLQQEEDVNIVEGI